MCDSEPHLPDDQWDSAFIFMDLAICMSFEMVIFSSLTYLEGFDDQVFLDF